MDSRIDAGEHKDCAGVCHGSAARDECGTCFGGTAGVLEDRRKTALASVVVALRLTAAVVLWRHDGRCAERISRLQRRLPRRSD